MNQVLDNYIVNAPNNKQGIIPEINFTCNGSVTTWIFGGQWKSGQNNIELQIWRNNESGFYGSTVINVTESNELGLYQYQLSLSLPFQVGDLDIHQPQSQSRLRLAAHMDPLQTIHLSDGNPDTRFISNSYLAQNVLVSVETGKFVWFTSVYIVPLSLLI